MDILPRIRDAWDLEIPIASPMPSWVTSKGIPYLSDGSRCLNEYRCMSTLSDCVILSMDVSRAIG